MKQQDITRMAREAGAGNFYPEKQSKKEDAYIVSKQFLERFAALVAAAEREECANVSEAQAESHELFGNTQAAIGCDGCINAIRARGQT